MFKFEKQLRGLVEEALEDHDWSVSETVETLANMIQYVVREYED